MSLSPLVFAEDRHDTLWGFERWLVSAHPAAPSVVAEGPFAGRRLDELVATFGAALAGTRAQGRFPLLFKDISARLRLSVQVHPSEATAPLTGGEPKTEAWRILAAEADAAIWLGVRPGISRDDLACAVAQNRVAGALVRQHVQAGEMYYIPAGLVHCLGDGVRVFEVQQSSDTTYRLYDWDRKDAAGRSRPLQVREALMAADPTLQTRRTEDEMVCPFFRMRARELVAAADFPADPETFRVLFAETGGIAVESDAGRHVVTEGNAILLPAVVAARVTPLAASARLLLVSLDDR